MNSETIDEDIIKKQPSGNGFDRLLGICRYAIGGLLIATVFNQVFRRSDAYQGTELTAFLTGTVFPALLAAGCAYYNFKQANHEKVSHGVVSFFSRPIVLVSIGVLIYYLLICVLSTVDLLASSVYNTVLITRILMALAIVVILKREFTYARQ